MTATDTEFDFSALTAETSASVPPQNDHTENDLTCTVCGTGLEYSGRGRKPTKCDAHKRKTSGVPGAPKRITGRSKAKGGTDYRPGIMGMMQLPAGVLAFAGMSKPELAADAAVLTIHGPNVAEALNELAKERPEVAAVLDRVLSVGPYGLLIAAVMPMVLQILANHGVLPSGLLGTVPKEALLSYMAEEAQRNEDALKAAMAA